MVVGWFRQLLAIALIVILCCSMGFDFEAG